MLQLHVYIILLCSSIALPFDILHVGVQSAAEETQHMKMTQQSVSHNGMAAAVVGNGNTITALGCQQRGQLVL